MEFPKLTVTEWVTIITLVTSSIFAGVKWAVPAFIQLMDYLTERRLKLSEIDVMEDEQLESGFKFAMRKQDRRITQLEKNEANLREQLHASRNETHQCHLQRALLEERVNRLTEQVVELKRAGESKK